MTYGDPCRECGFGWSIPLEGATTMVSDGPIEFTALLAGAVGDERHPDLGWSVAEYVCHVGDNLRIWAERLIGVAAGGPAEVGAYDEHELADARNYERIPLAAAMWSLGRAVDDWLGAVARSARTGPVLIHPERGAQALVDVARSNAHDLVHHRWDIERTLDGTES